MPLSEDILNAIPGDNPSGESLRHTPVWQNIKEALREDDGGAQGVWIKPRKMADIDLVIELASEALATKSKDLQLAAWLCEALLRKDGIPGLASGLDLCRGLLYRFWETLYPTIDQEDEGDPNIARCNLLSWLAGRMATRLQFVPICNTGHTFWDYRESCRIEHERRAETKRETEARSKALALRSLERAAAAEGFKQFSEYLLKHAVVEDDGQALIIKLPERVSVYAPSIADHPEGRLSPEDFHKSIAKTPVTFYANLVRGIDTAIRAVTSLDRLCDEKFRSGEQPSFLPLKTALSELRRVVSASYSRRWRRTLTPPLSELLEGKDVADFYMRLASIVDALDE